MIQVVIFFPFFNGNFPYLHFKCYSLSLSPLPNPLIPSPFPVSMSAFPLPLIPSHLPTLAILYNDQAIEPSQVQGPPLPLMPGKAILCYICSWSHGFLHVQSLVGGLVPVNSGWSSQLILFFLWDCNLLQFHQSYLISSTGVPMLSLMVVCEHLHLYWSGWQSLSGDSYTRLLFQTTQCVLLLLHIYTDTHKKHNTPKEQEISEDRKSTR